MKTTLFMAMSANGIIASGAGDEDFLSDEHWQKFCALARLHGNFIVGRKTYEAVMQWDTGYNFDDLSDIEKIIISHDQHFTPGSGYEVATSPEDALRKLSEKGKEHALITGGATINTAFAKAGLLDEVVVNIEPAFVGTGIPLFARGDFSLSLVLCDVEKSASGIVTLRYAVKK